MTLKMRTYDPMKYNIICTSEFESCLNIFQHFLLSQINITLLRNSFNFSLHQRTLNTLILFCLQLYKNVIQYIYNVHIQRTHVQNLFMLCCYSSKQVKYTKISKGQKKILICPICVQHLFTHTHSRSQSLFPFKQLSSLIQHFDA